MTSLQRNWAISWTKAEFLAVLLQQGPHTLDAVSIPEHCDDGCNPWRGRAVTELRKDGLIVRMGTANSTRKTRQGAVLRRWRIVNDADAAKHFQAVREWLALNPFPVADPPCPVLERLRIGDLLALHVKSLRARLAEVRGDCDEIDLDGDRFDKHDERNPYWNACNNITSAIEWLQGVADSLQGKAADHAE